MPPTPLQGMQGEGIKPAPCHHLHCMHGVDHFTWLLALVLLLASPVVPAMAGCGTIPPGEWVFIGEEGLDITGTGAAAGSQLAYYGPGGSVSSAPAAKVTVADPASFYVAPSVFPKRQARGSSFPATAWPSTSVTRRSSCASSIIHPGSWSGRTLHGSPRETLSVSGLIRTSGYFPTGRVALGHPLR